MKLDPKTGDYVLDEKGKIVQETGLQTPAYFRLKVQRENWMYAPDAKFGSTFYKAHRRVKDVVEIEDIARQALQPLITDRRALAIDVAADAVNRGGVSLLTRILDNRGRPEVYEFTSIGGA